MADRSYQGLVNNKQGGFFEERIIGGCINYDLFSRAFIEKTPEPFKISKSIGYGKFQGSFMKKAQPDFKGTLKEGKAIVFEAKYTSLDKMRASVLSSEQIKCLEKHYKLGAITGVVIGIKDKVFFVPWRLWAVMKEEYGRSYLKFEDIKAYEVKQDLNCVKFLDLKSGQKIEDNEFFMRPKSCWED